MTPAERDRLEDVAAAEWRKSIRAGSNLHLPPDWSARQDARRSDTPANVTRPRRTWRARVADWLQALADRVRGTR